MIKGLSELEKFELVHPLPNDTKYEQNNIPVIHKSLVDVETLNNINAINFNNLNKKYPNNDKLALMFKYDQKYLNRLWAHPFKNLALISSCFATATPDYSIQPGMNPIDVAHSVYKSRWFGVFWQSYNIRVFPTVSWWDKDSYDLCFSGIEKSSIVVVSTLGCQNNTKIFLDGYEELKKRIEPELIIVYGDLISGMEGTFINYKYEDAFAPKRSLYKQTKLFNSPRIFTVKGGVIHG